MGRCIVSRLSGENDGLRGQSWLIVVVGWFGCLICLRAVPTRKLPEEGLGLGEGL